MCLFVFKNATSQKMSLAQDICNMHGYKCTHTNMRILFLNHDYSFSQIQQYDNVGESCLKSIDTFTGYVLLSKYV